MVASSTITTTTTTPTLRPGKGKKQEVHDTRMIDGESIDGVSVENFTGFRKTAREFLLPYVKSGSGVIVSIQAYQHPYLTLFWNAISIVGSHDFFIAFFPFIIFGFGLKDIGGRLLQYAALSVYLGNVFKDYLCLPRPGAPVVQLDAHSSHGHEFGFPSTHSVSAVCLPFYLLFSQYSVYDPNFLPLFGLAVCYYTLVVFSRLYLGMHSIADIVGGSLIGASVLLGGLLVDVLDLYHLFPSTPASLFMTGLVLLLIHPEPYGPCPCFPDSACFLGSSFGLLVGNLRLRQYFTYELNTVSLYLFLTRWLIGAFLLFGGRVVYKPIIRKVGYSLFNMLGLPSRTFVHAHNSKPFGSPKWDLEILLKYVCYFAMCEVTLEFGPQIMGALGLNI